MKVAISGLSGSGVTTACRKVAEVLGASVANYTMHDLARELKEPFEKVQLQAEHNRRIDYLVDSKQMELGERNDPVVMGSRLACWLLQADLYVWLDAPLNERARRIHEREGGDLKKIIAFTKKRDSLNFARYKKVYGIDIADNSWVDLKINNSFLGADPVARIIVAAARSVEGNSLRPNPFKERIRKAFSKGFRKKA